MRWAFPHPANASVAAFRCFMGQVASAEIARTISLHGLKGMPDSQVLTRTTTSYKQRCTGCFPTPRTGPWVRFSRVCGVGKRALPGNSQVLQRMADSWGLARTTTSHKKPCTVRFPTPRTRAWARFSPICGVGKRAPPCNS